MNLILLPSLPRKIGVAVGVAVLIALLPWNMCERHQDKKDSEQALSLLERAWPE